jgi:hypothetical protein
LKKSTKIFQKLKISKISKNLAKKSKILQKIKKSKNLKKNQNLENFKKNKN